MGEMRKEITLSKRMELFSVWNSTFNKIKEKLTSVNVNHLIVYWRKCRT